MRIDPPASSRLLHVNLLLTAACLTCGWMWAHEQWLVITPFTWLCAYAAMLLLTFIETLGLRTFSKAESRRWRVTPQVAWCVCDHASVGWLIGGLLMLLILATDPAGRVTAWEWGNQQARRMTGSSFNDYHLWLRIAQMAAPALIGMLVFETLVFLGVRQCRFANTPASTAQQGPDDARADAVPASA